MNDMQFRKLRCLAARGWFARQVIEKQIASDPSTSVHVESPASRVSEGTSQFDYRVLFLVGRYWEIDDEFRFRSTLYIRGASASGKIFWRASPLRGRPIRGGATWFPTEAVSGTVIDRSVEVAGCAADPGLALDVFKIELIGDDRAGVFGGKTLTARKNWSGQMEGTYYFQDRKD